MRMYSRKKRLSLWSTLLVLFLSVLLSMTARTSRVLDVVHSADPESVFSFVGQTRQNVLEAYPQCQEMCIRDRIKAARIHIFEAILLNEIGEIFFKPIS